MRRLAFALLWGLMGVATVYGVNDLYRGRVGEGLCLLLLSAITALVKEVIDRLDSLERNR